VTRKEITNLAASVRARLERISRESGEDFQLVVTQYAIERTLFRLSKSSVADRFVLKGAQLFAHWMGRTHRPTRDLDLLGTGDPSPEAIAQIFQDICAMQIDPDGLRFDPHTVRVSEIRGNQEYPGQRVQFIVTLARMRIELQVDIGFGDVVTPAPQEIQFPVLLNYPAPVLRAYPQETVIAEKLQAMVVLGVANSRMKDFFDVWTMAQ
jgi:predicted nucleotidyltransferase component of viral defense system